MSVKEIFQDDSKEVAKLYFDENYGFRNMPVLFKNAFQGISCPEEIEGFTPAPFLESWLDKYQTAESPHTILSKSWVTTGDFNSGLRKNTWNLSSWHWIKSGELLWEFYPPITIDYLFQQNEINDLFSTIDNDDSYFINKFEQNDIKPLRVKQAPGELLYIPPKFGYIFNSQLGSTKFFSKIILNEYNHDNLYAYFRNTPYRNIIKNTIFPGFKNTTPLSQMI